jgi:hypothetical protein
VKARCDNCPAWNRRLRTVKVCGRIMALCEECLRIAHRLATEKAKAAR